jgi:sporulation protein YlmC with PRC-barrel domain
MAKDSERIRRDQAGVGPDPSYTGELVRLDDLHDFKVADGEPDIRGWEVCTLAGTEIGEVDDLLVDPRRGEIVMLDVDIKNSDRHAEVPLRAVQLDRSRKLVIVDSGEVDGFVPPTRRERLGAEERDRLRDTYRDTKRREVRYDLRDRDTREDDRAVVDEEGTVQETVVDRKPVVMEEVVVRRRTVDEIDDPDSDNR